MPQVLIAVAVLTAACSATSSSAPAASEAAVAADGRIFDELSANSRAWNEILTPVVAAYNDGAVAASMWVEQAGAALPKLQKITGAIGALVPVISHDQLRAAVADIAENYDDKLRHLTALHAAVANGDADAEQRSSAALVDAAERGRELAITMIDVVRQAAGPDADAMIAALEASRDTVEDVRLPADTAPEEPTATSNSSYVELTDATGMLYVEVPAAWTDVDTAPIDHSASLSASTDLDKMFDGAAAGIIFTMTDEQDHDAIVSTLDTGQDCDDIQRENYDDGVYSGLLEYGSACNNGRFSDVMVIAASPSSGAYTLIVILQLDPDDNDTALQIIDTFQTTD